VELGGARWPGCQRDEGEAAGSGRREPKGKTYFHKCAINTRASWADRVGFGPREERGQREPGGPKAGWASSSSGPKIRKKNFWIKNWIFEFTKALEFCRRRFRRNFDMRILLKFF
jgi:hypothetical protein